MNRDDEGRMWAGVEVGWLAVGWTGVQGGLVGVNSEVVEGLVVCIVWQVVDSWILLYELTYYLYPLHG